MERHPRGVLHDPPIPLERPGEVTTPRADRGRRATPFRLTLVARGRYDRLVTVQHVKTMPVASRTARLGSTWPLTGPHQTTAATATMHILLTNDDGVFAPGPAGLAQGAAAAGGRDGDRPGPGAERRRALDHAAEPPGRQAGRRRRRHDPGLDGRGEPGRQRQAGDLRADAPAPRPDRLGDQLGLERRDQRPLLGHGRRGDRGGVLQDHQRRRLARAGRALRLPPRRPARRPGHRADPGEQAAQRLAVQRQPARALAGRAQGGPRRADGHRPLRRGLRAPAGPPRAGPITG